MKSVKILAAVLALAVLLGLSSCGRKAKIAAIEEITQVVTPADLEEFRTYPNLKKLDATGSTCYSALIKFIADCPQVDVTYTVPLGSTEASNKVTSLVLQPGDASFDALQKNLRYLPGLTALTLSRTELTPGQLNALGSVYPALELSYSVDILGKEYAPDATSIDLSTLEETQLDAVLHALVLLPELTDVELTGSSISMEQVKQIADALPTAAIRYTFDLFGQTLSTDTEEVEFKNVSIGNQGETAIRQALDIMPGCKRFVLDDCGLDNEVLAGLRADYPDSKIVWRVHFGKYSVLTDTDTIKAVYNVFDDTVADLKYCTDVKYIDMGHNDTLTDIRFMGYMPKLEIVIVSGSAVADISCFANCPNLEFLEMAYCWRLSDVSALKECTALRFLNLSYTDVTDLEPLDSLPLERFVCIQSKVPYEEREIFTQFHPDCWIRFKGEDPYSLGWRYEDVGETFSPYYLKMRDIFGYK